MDGKKSFVRLVDSELPVLFELNQNIDFVFVLDKLFLHISPTFLFLVIISPFLYGNIRANQLMLPSPFVHVSLAASPQLLVLELLDFLGWDAVVFEVLAHFTVQIARVQHVFGDADGCLMQRHQAIAVADLSYALELLWTIFLHRGVEILGLTQFVKQVCSQFAPCGLSLEVSAALALRSDDYQCQTQGEDRLVKPEVSREKCVAPP